MKIHSKSTKGEIHRNLAHNTHLMILKQGQKLTQKGILILYC